MIFKKGFKVLGTAIVSTLIFAQTAVAVPTNIYFQDANGAIVAASYTTAATAYTLGNDTMYNALKAALNTATNAGKIIFIQDDSGKVIDYRAAINAHESYANALIDSNVNNATVPTATATMGSTGEVIPINSQFAVISID